MSVDQRPSVPTAQGLTVHYSANSSTHEHGGTLVVFDRSAELGLERCYIEPDFVSD